MSAGRLILILVVVGVGLYLWQHSAKSLGTGADSERASPIDRARTARASSDANAASREASQSAADSNAPAAGVTENMTPDQVRALLGTPSETRTETMDNGGTREIWTYSQAGKTVVFENGVAVSVR